MARRSAIKRDRRLVTGLGGLAAASALAVGAHMGVAEPPLPDLVPIYTTGAPVIGFVGDTMLGDSATPFIDAHGISAPFVSFAGRLTADVTIANLETPITTVPRQGYAKKYDYASPPEAAAALAAAGIDAVSIANNHSLDRGEAGLIETRSLTEQSGMAVIGGGRNIAEAQRPLVVQGSDATVAVVTLAEDYGVGTRASDITPGILTLSPSRVQRALSLARATRADRIVVFVHWGDNYASVNDEQRYWADQLVKAGADLVIGAGSHTAQEIVLIEGVPVVYGLGNFVFGSNGRFQPAGSGRGLMVDVSWDTSGAGTLTATCLFTDNSVVKFVPRVCTASEAAAQFASIDKAGMSVAGSSATLRF